MKELNYFVAYDIPAETQDDKKTKSEIITVPINDSIAELESDTEFIALYNAEKTPPAYLNH